MEITNYKRLTPRSPDEEEFLSFALGTGVPLLDSDFKFRVGNLNLTKLGLTRGDSTVDDNVLSVSIPALGFEFSAESGLQGKVIPKIQASNIIRITRWEYSDEAWRIGKLPRSKSLNDFYRYWYESQLSSNGLVAIGFKSGIVELILSKDSSEERGYRFYNCSVGKPQVDVIS